jgi:urease alpha subunit
MYATSTRKAILGEYSAEQIVTYHRWRKEQGSLRADQAKGLKATEVENTRLRKVIADLTIGNAILKEASRGNLR